MIERGTKREGDKREHVETNANGFIVRGTTIVWKPLHFQIRKFFVGLPPIPGRRSSLNE